MSEAIETCIAMALLLGVLYIILVGLTGCGHEDPCCVGPKHLSCAEDCYDPH